MVEAMQAGADVVGGMPHWERSEDEQREHVHVCFDLAQRFDADVDMHVDETDDGSIRTLAMVADETIRRGWQGRVTVGHVCALSAADQGYADHVIAQCAAAHITVVSNPGNQPGAARTRRSRADPPRHHAYSRADGGRRQRRIRAGLRQRRLLSVRARRHARGRAHLGPCRAPDDRPTSWTLHSMPSRRRLPARVAARRRIRATRWGSRRPAALRGVLLAGGAAPSRCADARLALRPAGGHHARDSGAPAVISRHDSASRRPPPTALLLCARVGARLVTLPPADLRRLRSCCVLASELGS